MKRIAIAAALCLSFVACATVRNPVHLASAGSATVAESDAAVSAAAAPAAVLCPACKVIIDYGALQSASADSEKSAYAQWETVLAGLESGAWTWDEVGPLAYEVCEWADEIRARTAKLEKTLRELAERKPKGGGQ